MQTTTMALHTEQPSEKEKWYIFVDFANVYKDADKVDKGFRPQFEQAHAGASTAGASAAIAESSVIMKTASKLPVENLKESMTEFVKTLRVEKKVADKAIIPAVKNQLMLLKKQTAQHQEQIDEWIKQLKTVDGKNKFLNEDFPVNITLNTPLTSANRQKPKGPIFWLRANHLRYICSRANTNDDLVPKERAYMFASHSPHGREKYMNSRIYQEMQNDYTVRLHERVQRHKHQAEKGVDVDLAVHVIDTIREAAKKNEKIRIVLVSGDSDFKPVVEFCSNRKVPIDVWAWASTNTTTKRYKEYLREAPGVTVFWLDNYLYQLGYPPKDLVHPYGLALFFRDQPPTRKQREIYDHIMHFTIAERLTLDGDQTLGFKTWDFVLHWGPGQWRNSTGQHSGPRGLGFTISFYKEESRAKFEQYVSTSSDDLAKNLNRLERLKKSFTLDNNVVVGENEEKAPSEEEKQNCIDDSWSPDINAEMMDEESEDENDEMMDEKFEDENDEIE